MDAIEEGEQIKDVYAYFGRAFYEASCVETGLSIALLYVDFLVSEKRTFQQRGLADFDRKEYKRRFDQFMKSQHDQTFGNLLRRIDSVSQFGDELKSDLKKAKQKRDFLSHHYFRERALEFATPRGRRSMIAELDADAQFFLHVDQAVQKSTVPVQVELGIKTVAMDRYKEVYAAAIKRGSTAEEASSLAFIAFKKQPQPS